jgi:3-methyladenine DNA glycosylase/8-oxoguanine DNA glycosylase
MSLVAADVPAATRRPATVTAAVPVRRRSGQRILRLGGIDPATALPSAMGSGDPSARRMPGAFVRALHTPRGPGTVAFAWAPGGDARVDAWGEPDAVDWLLDAAPSWLGLNDDVSTFRPAHPLVAEVWRRHRHHRLGATGTIWPELVPTIVSQRVQFVDAAASWRRLVRRWGSPAPGPSSFGLLLPPGPAELRGRSYVDLHRFDLERRRADSILVAARRAGRLEEAAAMPPGDAVARLSALPGLGAWTATTVAAAALGDPDTVVLRDFWMPTIVRHALTGNRSWCDDDGQMLELLEPFAGHRWRVVCLLAAAGFQPARRAPRRERHRIAHF